MWSSVTEDSPLFRRMLVIPSLKYFCNQMSITDFVLPGQYYTSESCLILLVGIILTARGTSPFKRKGWTMFSFVVRWIQHFKNQLSDLLVCDLPVNKYLYKTSRHAMFASWWWMYLHVWLYDSIYLLVHGLLQVLSQNVQWSDRIRNTPHPARWQASLN